MKYVFDHVIHFMNDSGVIQAGFYTLTEKFILSPLPFVGELRADYSLD